MAHPRSSSRKDARAVSDMEAASHSAAERVQQAKDAVALEGPNFDTAEEELARAVDALSEDELLVLRAKLGLLKD